MLRRLALAIPFWGSTLLAALPSSAQDLGGSLHVGTLGLGGRAAVSVGRQVVLRGGADFQPFAIEFESSDVAYDLMLAAPSLSALIDWHPGAGGFRLSGGLTYFADELELESVFSGPTPIGDNVYEAEEIGALVGNLGTSRFAPYVGIGWGNSTRLGISFAWDLGVAIHGTPDVELRATGPARDDPQFEADLESELSEVNSDIERAKVYPVLTFGFGFGI